MSEPSVPPVVQRVVGDRNVIAGRDVNITNNFSEAQTADRANLLLLLAKVKEDWINGFLQQALHNKINMQVRKQFCDAEVNRPWDSVRETLERPKAAPAADPSISDIFDAAGRALLILGEPGSGKTITMLSLAQTLVERAGQDPNQPIPTILNLSTWTGKEPLSEWLIRELSVRYYTGRRLGESWLKEGRLLLLLDGLDEVQPQHQARCVTAINSFVKEYGGPGLVVCSRKAEYQALNQKLNLNAAVVLQALTFEESARYLAGCGPKLAGLLEAVQSDQGLQELASSPLMLHFMAMAYEERSTATFARDSRASMSERKAELLDTYIEKAFERKKNLPLPHSQDRTLFWLRWMADKVLRNSQNAIVLEHLQPAWLETKGQVCSYLLLSRLILGLLVSAMAYCGGSSAGYALTVVFFGTMVGVADIVRLVWWRAPVNKTIFGFAYIGGGVLCFMLAFGLFTKLLNHSNFSLVDTTGIFWGSIYAVFFWLRSRNRNLNNDIQTLEVIQWSWRKGRKAAVVWALSVTGVISGLVMILFIAWILSSRHDLQGNPGLNAIAGVAAQLFSIPDIRAVTVFQEITVSVVLAGFCGLIYGLIFGLVALLLGGITQGILVGKSHVNQGVMLTFRNSLFQVARVAGTFFGVLLCLEILVGLAQGHHLGSILQNLYSTVYLTLNVATATWLGLGAIDLLNHYFLRLWMAALGYMPLRYARFLDYTARLRLTQRVGGSYVFIHRLLLEHLAGQYRTPPRSQAGLSRNKGSGGGIEDPADDGQ